MIQAEHIHDALTLLPEELLAPVDALRRKKRVPWKSLTAVAACLCLVAGLWFLLPGAVAMDSSNGSAEHLPADGCGSSIFDSITQESECGKYLTATVVAVHEDHIEILPGEKLPDNATVSMSYAVTVRFDRLETIPTLRQWQFVRLYFREIPEISQENAELFPYRIEIIENEGG